MWRVKGAIKNKNLILIRHGREKLKKLKLFIASCSFTTSSEYKSTSVRIHSLRRDDINTKQQSTEKETLRIVVQSQLFSCSKNKENIVSNFECKIFRENVLEKKESTR